MATNKAVRLCSRFPLMMLWAFSMQGQQFPAPTVAVPGPGEVLATQPAAVAYSAPRVSCQGNQLTVDAQNATLGSVLAAVHDCLGVEITMPDGAAEDRSYVRLGPGPTREVLDELLSSTKYSYAIQSSPSVPGKISSILLIAASKDSGNASDSSLVPPPLTDAPMTPQRRAWMESVRTARTSGTPADDGQSSTAAPVAVVPSNSDGSATASTTPNAGAGGAGMSDSTQPSNAAGSSSTAASSATPDAVAPPASTQVPGSSAPSQQAQPADDLHNKIDQMQQLFEQRKKMAAGQSQPPS